MDCKRKIFRAAESVGCFSDGFIFAVKKQKKEKKGCRTGSVAAYVQRVIKVKDLQFSPGPPTASHPFRNY